MIRTMFMASFVFSVVACATPAPQVNAQADHPMIAKEKEDAVQNGTKYLEEAWADQRKCYTAWAVLLSEWRANGGGIKDSIVATREQIATDKKSKFAQIVRQVWASQKLVHADHSLRIGSWPVSDGEFRRVFEGSDTAAEAIQPEECQTFVWLDSLLWEEVLERENGKTTVRKLRETPADMEWLGHDASLWIRYWLFVRLD